MNLIHAGAAFLCGGVFWNPIPFIEISFAFLCTFALIIDRTSLAAGSAGFEANPSQKSGEALPEFLERLE
jgi:hypothetical protein